MNNKIFYKKISNVDLREEIIKSQENGHPTERFMIICYTMAHKILRQSRFFKTTSDWKEDACSQSLIKCCDVYQKFDLSLNSSAYAFFHTTILRAIYDTFSKDYYKYFDMKRELLRYSSASLTDQDPFFDNFNINEDDKYLDSENSFKYKNLPSSRKE